MTKKLVGAVFLLLFVIGGTVLFDRIRGPAPVTTRIVLTGTGGAEVTGTYVADGQEIPIHQVLPAEITISAKQLSFLVRSADPSENLFARVFINDQHRVSGGATGAQITVRGETMFSSVQVYLEAFAGSPES